MELRRLNEEGIKRFNEYLGNGAKEYAPVNLLSDSLTSEPLEERIYLDRDRIFADKYIFGDYLVSLLAPLDNGRLELDRGLWTALCIAWFDQICPRSGIGVRKILKPYYYILSNDYRHHYRHLVRSPWQLVRDHSEHSKFLLLPSQESTTPLKRHGEILEQLGARQALIRSKTLMVETSRLFSDPKTGRPLKGVSGNGPGSARRLGLVLRQFDLTYDIESMINGTLINLLPKEFDRWPTKTKSEGSSPIPQESMISRGVDDV